ncbi:hypothetical protein [Methylomicrobium lacus]|uniref:hypothetical protein n=1 Tax=Methylomicrobium lacus TaxID=136992 RepID=UPI0035A8790D
MSNYRRYYVPGGSYFFTVVTERRAQILGNGLARDLFRAAFPNCFQKIKTIHLIIFCVLILIGLQFGCATTPPLPLESPYKNSSLRLTKTAVIPSDFLPKTSFNTFAKGRMAGAGRGILKGLKTLVGAPAIGLGVDIVGGTAGLGTLLGMTYGALYLPASPILGAMKAVPEKESKKIEQAIPNILSKLNVQESFANHVIKTSVNNLSGYHLELLNSKFSEAEKNQSYKNLKLEGFDSILELAIDEIGFDGGEGGNPSIAFLMKGHYRLLYLADNSELSTKTLSYISSKHKLSEWLANDSQQIQNEFDEGYHRFATETLENSFLLVDLPAPMWSADDHCMLRPLYPEFGFGLLETGPEYYPIDSLQPTLKWESFPREIDIKSFSNPISEVTYDLQIWSVITDSPGDLVYEKSKLSTPFHKLEQPLISSNRYFWTVRARFKLNGQQRITNWSYSRKPGAISCSERLIPDANYFRFTTP